MAVAKENKKYHFLLFLISPVLALIYGIRTKQKVYIRWSIFVFVVIYGSTMHPSHLGDGATHFNILVSQPLDKSFSVFWEEIISILTLAPKSGTGTDPYIHILRYVLGTLFNAPRLLFVVVSIIFGYFYSGAIVKLLSYVQWNSNYNKFYFLFFLVLFLLFQTPGDMQSVRQGTAVWVLIYAVISYQQTKKLKYILLVLFTPFIHAGFLALAVPFLVVMLSGYRKPLVYFVIFMISVLASNLVNPVAVNDFASQTEVGAGKAKAYTYDDERREAVEKGISKKAENARFYKTYQSSRIHFNVFTGLVIFMFLILRNRGFGEIENALFSYGLAGASFANFLSFNFAIYARDWTMASVFILALLLIFLSKQNLNNIRFSSLKVKLPLFILSVLLFPYVLFLLSANLDFTSFYTLFLPVTMWFNFDMGLSIRGFLGLLI